MIIFLAIIMTIYFLGHSLLAALYCGKENDSFFRWFWILFKGHNTAYGAWMVYGLLIGCILMVN